MRIRFLALLLVLSGCATAPPEAPHARGDSIRFVSKSGVATANGVFHEWRILAASVAPDDLGRSFVEIEIDVASVDTGVARRDDHLRNADFFEVERWPKARVRVFGVQPRESGAGIGAQFSARFDVQIRDHRETLDGEFTLLSERPLIVEGRIEIDRTAFGIGSAKRWWNPMSPGEAVPIHFRVTLESP